MLFVDAGSNEVGIGTSDPRSPLHVSTTHTVTDVTSANTNSTLSIGNTGAGNGVYNAIKFSGNQQDMYIMSFNNATQADRRLGFFVGSTAGDAAADERLSITGDGNVLVGTTSTDTAAVGFRYRSSLDAISSVADGGISAYFGRRSSAGDIVALRKDDAIIGSIGVSAFSGLQLGSASGTGFRFDTNDIMPMKSGSAIDATVNLGYPSVRFKDLYLSGGAYLGGAVAANKLDDYEEGTWTPTFRDLNGNLATLSTALGSYTKIGRQVILNFNLTLSSKGSMTGDFCLMGNLPFSHPNNAYNGTGHIDKFTNLDTAVSGLSFDISSTTTLMWLMGVAAAGSGSSQYISTSYIGGNEQFKGTCIYYTDD